MTTPLIELSGIGKTFAATRALDQVSFGIGAGAVHALVGENGAGKSTLMKILMGIHQPDQGEVRLAGAAVKISGPIAAHRLGLAIVFQEIELCANLSIRENFFLGRELSRGAALDFKAMRARTEEVLAEVGLGLPAETPVEKLSVAQKQLVQIGRAILSEPRVLILDEPTSALSGDGVAALFKIVRRLHERGVTVLYISHKLEEIFALADMITVLKDGRLVKTVPTAEVGVADLVGLMVGRELDLSKRRAECAPGGCALEVERLTGAGFAEVSLTVAAGEIVGIAGLVGAGRTELVETIFGIRGATGGRVLVGGRDLATASVTERIAAGMGLVPEDRQGSGLVFTMDLRENLTLPDLALNRLGGLGIDRAQQLGEARAAMKAMRVVASGTEATPDSLSGGNQQKIVIGKWLGVAPSLLILDEPTRGIDVGAKAEVHDFIRGLADQGKSCLVISSELPELLALADRIYVMSEGRLRGVVDGATATEERIMGLALGGDADRELQARRAQ
jgi:ribose transport system ATP-binding protein